MPDHPGASVHVRTQHGGSTSERPGTSRNGRDRLLGTGQRVLAVGIAVLMSLTFLQASATSRVSQDAVRATTGAQTTTALIAFTQRESLATIVAVNRWLDGSASRRDLQIARALLARRLATADDAGQTAADLAGPEYRAALEALDAAWSTAAPGPLASTARPAAASVVGPALIDFTEQSKHLTDRYQRYADDVLAATSEAVRGQNQRQLFLLLLTLGAGVVLLAWLARDVRRKYQAATVFEFRATHDGLTGLVNRSKLLERVHDAIRLEGEPGLIALMFIDLDDFKLVNDERGHRFGDRLLAEVAHRLSSTVGVVPGTTVARLGGDEFVVLCSRVSGPAEAGEVAARVLEVLAEPVFLGGEPVVVGASVGMALGDPETTSPEQLLGEADHAMYEAKRSDSAAYRRFTSGI